MAKKSTTNLQAIKKAFTAINDSKSKLGLTLVDKAEFLAETLIELEEEIKANGVVTSMCQGKYSIERENPALKSYNATIKSYNTVIKQLVDLLPENKETKDGEDLLKFIAGSKR